MKSNQIFLVILFSVGMGIGQLLLKFAAIRQGINTESNFVSRLFALIFDWPFIIGSVSYAFLLIYWVWLLTFLPLSRAYPFTCISLAVAALGGSFFFHETITLRFVAGLAAIAIGLLLLGSE